MKLKSRNWALNIQIAIWTNNLTCRKIQVHFNFSASILMSFLALYSNQNWSIASVTYADIECEHILCTEAVAKINCTNNEFHISFVQTTIGLEEHINIPAFVETAVVRCRVLGLWAERLEPWASCALRWRFWGLPCEPRPCAPSQSSSPPSLLCTLFEPPSFASRNPFSASPASPPLPSGPAAPSSFPGRSSEGGTCGSPAALTPSPTSRTTGAMNGAC